MNIPVSRPYLTSKETEYVTRAIQKTEISGTFGEYLPRFENEFARYCGARYGVATNNGTTALHLAVAALGISKGDEVLTATFTNMASAFAVSYVGAIPIPIDIEGDTWNINPSLLESKITPRTKAIMVVHIYGHPVDMDPVLEFAKKYNLFVIEDCAEAHGAEYKGKRVGSLGDIGVFSFYANKIITTGEGGMVVMNNENLAKHARLLGTLAYGPAGNRFMHQAVGFNYRMPNTIAAIGCAQLEKIDEVIAMKRRMAEYYSSELKGNSYLQLPVEKPNAKNVYWMYHVVLQGKFAGRRAEILKALKEKGIEAREAFTPINQQELFIKESWTREEDCPVANRIGRDGFYIPSGPIISREEQSYVAETLRSILAI